MISLLFVWILLTLPMDRITCSLWVSTPPTMKDVRTACGPISYLDRQVVEAVQISSGMVVCSKPATQLPTLPCNLKPLGNFRLNVVWKNFQNYICAIKITHEGKPTSAEVKAQCPQAPKEYELRFDSKQEQDQASEPVQCHPPTLSTGSGPDELPEDSTGLATSHRLQYLAGQLIWNGISHPNCSGYSGMAGGGMANECGMDSTFADVIAWQNKLDLYLWQAGASYNVPPRRMKQILLIETQMWPLAVGKDGERGMIQMTEAAADLVLRSSPDLYAEFCPSAIFPGRCNSRTYDTLTGWEKAYIRLALLADLDPGTTSPQEALQFANVSLFARMLAAAWCAIPEPSWERVIAAWHAGYTCVATETICKDGLDYIAKFK